MNEIEKTIEDLNELRKKCSVRTNMFKEMHGEHLDTAISALELLKLKDQGKVIITPCAVGDYIRTKYDDDILRVDGFTTYGDDLKVWGEGESEHYIEFELSEITEFIPRENLDEADKI